MQQKVLLIRLFYDICDLWGICSFPCQPINVSFVFINSISEIEPKYYADGEDAYAMKRDLTGLKLEVGFYFSIISWYQVPRFVNAD